MFSASNHHYCQHCISKAIRKSVPRIVIKYSTNEILFREMWSILNLSVKLLENILVTKRSPSRYISLLAASALYSLYIMMILDQQQSGEDVSEYLNRLRRMIKEWLVDFNVIGPFAFGGSYENNWKGRMELEVK